jgi:hypothetical protein
MPTLARDGLGWATGIWFNVYDQATIDRRWVEDGAGTWLRSNANPLGGHHFPHLPDENTRTKDKKSY